MPGTPSPNLGLTLNVESDPFKLADFIANWDILDTNPGVSIVSALPGSGAFTGQTVYLTTDNLLHSWNGTAWSGSSLPLGWHFFQSPNVSVTTGSGSPYTSSSTSFSTPVATWAQVNGSADVHIILPGTPVATPQGVTVQFVIDGSNVAQVHYLMPGYGATAGAWFGTEITNVVANFQNINLTAGSHTIEIQSFIDQTAGGNPTVTLVNWQCNLIAFEKGPGSQ